MTLIGNVKMTDPEGIKAIADKIRNDNEKENYLVLKYKDKDTIETVDSGEGVYESFSKYFEEDQVVYVMWRCIAGDAQSARPKFVFLHWVGPKTKALWKVTAMTHADSVKKHLGYFHVSIQGANAQEINVDTIKEKIRVAGGVRYDTTEKFNGQDGTIEK